MSLVRKVRVTIEFDTDAPEFMLEELVAHMSVQTETLQENLGSVVNNLECKVEEA